MITMTWMAANLYQPFEVPILYVGKFWKMASNGSDLLIRYCQKRKEKHLKLVRKLLWGVA